MPISGVEIIDVAGGAPWSSQAGPGCNLASHLGDELHNCNCYHIILIDVVL